MFYHKAVLLNEILDNINLKNNGIYFDCTLGGGGHSLAILEKINNSRLICLDQDEEAINFQSLLKNNDKVTLIHENFINIDVIAYLLNIEKIDFILMDLGISSWQIDQPSRGFSYIKDGTLDMRMDNLNDLTAYHIVNSYNYENLCRIIKEYGEERRFERIAKKIIEQRTKKIIKTTLDLVQIIKEATYTFNYSSVKKVFQALRIEVNNELFFLELALKKSLNLLNFGGRLAIISFHSLEDRIVKETFKEYSSKGYKLITKKPIISSKDEILENSRSKSAKLRIIEKNES